MYSNELFLEVIRKAVQRRQQSSWALKDEPNVYQIYTVRKHASCGNTGKGKEWIRKPRMDGVWSSKRDIV
jgi:hypothetical protein